MKFIIFTFFCAFLFAENLSAQNAKVTGMVKDSVSQGAVLYATVSLYAASDNHLVSSAITDEKGQYEITKIPFGDYYLKVSCLGYKTKTTNPVKLAASQKSVKANVSMHLDVEALGEVVVTTDRIEFRPDKKILHIDPTLAAGGASVADALQTLPEIRVEGETVTLKTYAPTILVNGRPAGAEMKDLTKIPASLISSIEVITNPSVKYNPEGLGGIINLKTKKAPLGINGMLQGSASTNNQFTAVGTLNRRTEKWNLFASLYERYTGLIESGTVEEQYNEGYSKKQAQESTPRINRIYTRLGADYYLDSMNVFTLYWENSLRKGKQNMATTYDETGIPFPRSNNGDVDMAMASNDNQIGFNYTHTFKNKTELTADITQSFGKEPYGVDLLFGGLDTAKYFNDFDYNAKENVAEINYASPLFKKWMLEVGAASAIENIRIDDSLAQYTYNEGIWNSQYNHLFELNRFVGSTYATLGRQLGQFSFQAGLRGEYTDENLYANNAKIRNNDDYFSLFPSGGVNYQTQKQLNATLSYSRRIQRPSSAFNLSPFATINYQYPANRNIGNPNLAPAYSNSIDLSVNQKMTTITWNVFASYLHTGNNIVNTYYSENDIFYTTWSNVATTRKFILSTSLDYHARLWKIYRPILNLSMNEDIYETSATGRTNYFNYNASLTNIFYLPHKISVYFYVTYTPTTYQYASKSEEMWNLRLRFQKKFKDNFTVAIAFYNMLNANPTTYSYGNNFTAKSVTDNNTQAVYIGFYYKFGKPIKTRANVNLNLNQIEMQ